MLAGSALIMPLSALLEPRTEGPILQEASSTTMLATRLLQLVAMGGAALALARGGGGRRAEHWRRSQLVFGGLLLWTLTRFMADFHAGVHHTSLVMALLVMTGYFLVVHSEGGDARALLWTARVYTVGSLVGAVAIPDQVFCVLPGDDRSLFGMARLCGLTGQPNTLGEIAGMALLLELSNVVRTTMPRRILFGSLAAGSLLLSQSRTAWMACLVALALMWVWQRSRSHPGSVGVLALVGLFVVTLPFLLFPQLSSSPLLGGGSSNSDLTTVNGRAAIWAAAMAEFHRSPVFGYGLNLYDADFTAAHLPYGLQMVRDSHSQFVQTLGESGIVGFIGLMSFILACAWVAWRRWREDSPLPAAVLTFMLLRCFTESGLMFDGIGWQLWCLFFLATCMLLPLGGRSPSRAREFAHVALRRLPRRAVTSVPDAPSGAHTTIDNPSGE